MGRYDDDYEDRDQKYSPPRRRDESYRRDGGRRSPDHRRRSPSPSRRRPRSRSPHRRPSEHNHHRRQRSHHHRDDDIDHLPPSQQKWGKPELHDNEDQQPEKEPEPEFGLSGLLAAETNTVNGIVLLHNEPPEARPPTSKWRLYVFKNGQPYGDPLYIHKQSRYLFGKERKIADIPTDHPSCSKQHAVIQFRATEKEGTDGMMHTAVRPYLMDLKSTNGTWLNNERVESERYYELLEKDMLKFGHSSREYVLLKE